jgi:hypothetical protein
MRHIPKRYSAFAMACMTRGYMAQGTYIYEMHDLMRKLREAEDAKEFSIEH